MFGTLHPVWPPEPLLGLLLGGRKDIELCHVGQIGAGGEMWEQMVKDYRGKIVFRRLGELPALEIADVLRNADFGIATTPWEIIGKSATATAMLENGLPVIVNRDDVHIPGWTDRDYDPQLIKMDSNLVERLRAARRRPPASRLPSVARAFLEQLTFASASKAQA